MDMKKILVIDDEKNIRTLVRNCLQESAYEVDIAVNGEEGYSKLKESVYDVALIDIKMPGISGLELLRMLRDNGIQIDVVMMTAYGTVERAVEAMKLGAIDFISKPFTPDEIRRIIKSVLDRKLLDESTIETFPETLEFAKSCILSKDIDKAVIYLKKAMGLDLDSPEPHNLLGVISEMNGDVLKAQQHYRAAIALDPTHKAANNNLTRTVIDGFSKEDADLGKTLTEKPEGNKK
ncbi:MAG: response regulator [Clostridia bacterium]|nr:response regulator [Clostridia bacterium]MBN2883005.1 response regulator [Clostridia bacterium]